MTPSSYRPLISTNPIFLPIRLNDILIHILDSYATIYLENAVSGLNLAAQTGLSVLDYSKFNLGNIKHTHIQRRPSSTSHSMVIKA
jgi:hypothetical protein